MDSDEIKQTRSMRDVLAAYGLHPNRSGFIRCPFHLEKTPSFKVYKDSFYCFGCGQAGDVFKFVELMDGVAFKDAFLSLGGDYPNQTKKSNFAHKLRQYHFKQQRKMEEKSRTELDVKKRKNSELIDKYRDVMNAAEPLSDAWCQAYNKYQYQIYEQCLLNGLEGKW